MKNSIIAVLAMLALSGCVTRKIPVLPEARLISPISEVGVQQLSCTLIETFTLEDSHPNNVAPVLKNQTYLSGGNRYRIATVLTERRGRPTGVVADIYACSSAHQVKPTGM